ncbi:hypothetical protein ACWCYY_19285 [Kitasatospora sp. NPDC001664]
MRLVLGQRDSAGTDEVLARPQRYEVDRDQLAAFVRILIDTTEARSGPAVAVDEVATRASLLNAVEEYERAMRIFRDQTADRKVLAQQADLRLMEMQAAFSDYAQAKRQAHPAMKVPSLPWTANEDQFFVPTVPVGPKADVAAEQLDSRMTMLFERLGPPPDAVPDDGSWGVEGPPGESPDEPTMDDVSDLSERAARW